MLSMFPHPLESPLSMVVTDRNPDAVHSTSRSLVNQSDTKQTGLTKPVALKNVFSGSEPVAG